MNLFSSTTPAFLLLGLLIFSFGCQEESKPEMSAAEHARRVAKDDSTTIRISPEQLRKNLKTNEMATFQAMTLSKRTCSAAESVQWTR